MTGSTHPDASLPEIDGYADLEPIGSGGFSRVYRAYQEQFDREVALKVLTFALADEQSQRAFQRECRATGRLTGHPNIVTVLDSGLTQQGVAFLTMPYFARGSLGGRLENHGPLETVAEVLRVGVKTAGALETAHAAGILHRDVKPQNILMSKFDEPALADFGISIIVDRSQSLKASALTPIHAPPEALEGTRFEARGDVYSLASTLFALLTGRAPFQRDADEGVYALIVRVLTDPVPDIPRDDVPASLMRVLREAMAKDPEARPGSAAAFGHALRGVEAELGLPVTEMTGPDATTAPSIAPVSEMTGAATVGTTRTGWGPPVSPALPTIAPPDDPPVPDPTAPAPRARRRTVVAVVAGMIVLATAATALALSSGSPNNEGPAVSTTAPAPAAPAEPSLAPGDVQIEVMDATSIRATWTDRTEGRLPHVVQRAPADAGTSLTPADAGTTSVLVADLDPDLGYCFRVGAVTGVSETAQVAWSEPECIRGATVGGSGIMTS